MISKNSFTANQKELLKRRLWPTALAFLLPFLNFVVGEALTFANTQTVYERSQLTTATDLAKELQDQMLMYFQPTNPLLLLSILSLAVILAMQGFAWIDSRVQLDFYESQPVSRTARFFRIHVNSLLIFWCSFTVSAFFGLLIAVAYRVPLNGAVLGQMAWFYLQNLCFFYAVYMMTLLAVMLTGNILVACLASAVFIGYEYLLRMILHGLGSQFLVGYVYPDNTPDALTSPFFLNFMNTRTAICGNLLLGTIFLILSYLAYQKRKNEAAGTAVVFRPVRIVVKVAIIFIGSLLIGLVGFMGFSSMTAAVLLLILAGMIIGCIMEIIYHYDFKALFSGLAFHGLGIVLALLTLFAYRMDAFGYQRWIPDPANVSYAVISYDYEYYTNHYLEDGSPVNLTSEFYQAYMRLTDIEAVNRLLTLGMETSLNQTETEDYTTPHFSVTMKYRMKNGRIKSRSVSLPFDQKHAALYDEIFGSEEFRQGYFQIYHDQFLRDDLENLSIHYSNNESETQMTKVDGRFYDAFNAAYMKDLQTFNYSLATDTPAIGFVELRLNDPKKQDIYGSVADIRYPVYRSFDNTIAFLRESGLWIEPSKQSESGDLYIPAPFQAYFDTLKDGQQVNVVFE